MVQERLRQASNTFGFGSPTAPQWRERESPSLATAPRGGDEMNGLPITENNGVRTL